MSGEGENMARRPVVIVTGASRGIGAATAQWLGRSGAAVSLIARTAADLETSAEAVRRSGGEALPIAADIALQESCRSAVARTLDRFGRIDALVNAAGVLGPIARAADAPAHDWVHNLAVNVFGPFYLIQAALPQLRDRGGCIVNVSSGAAENAVEGWSAYCSAKAALTHFTRVLAAEEPNVTAVSVRPGVVDTAMQAIIRQEGDAGMRSEKIAYFKRLKADGALEPAHVPGRVIAWLALHAPQSMSGRFVDYQDADVAEAALARFGSYEE